MIFTSMYLGPTFSSFENLGIETGQVLARLTGVLVSRVQTNVLCYNPSAQARFRVSVAS